MALNWVYVARKDLGRGIDTFSARGGVPDGFAEDLVNFDTSASGKLTKRRGYEPYLGWLPWPVTQIEMITDSGDLIGYRLYFNESDFDNTELVPGPVLLYGRCTVSDDAGTGDDFYLAADEDRLLWFPTWSYGSNSESIEVYDARLADDAVAALVVGAVEETQQRVVVWGLHSDVVKDHGTDSVAPGVTTWLDAYRRAGESRVCAGAEGLLCRGVTQLDTGEAATWGLTSPSATFQTAATASGSTKLAPLFYTTNPGAVRTRGLAYDASVVDHYAKVTAATYHSGSGYVDYTLTWSAKTGTIALNSQITTSDKLTVTGLSHALLNGTFSVVSVVSDSASETVIRVANSNVTSSTWDVTGAAGRAGVFTDTFQLGARSALLVDDQIVKFGSTSVSGTMLVDSVSDTTVYVSGVTETVTATSTVRAQRTAATIPIADATGLVPGDVLSDGTKQVQLLEVYPQDSQAATLSGSAGSVTVTVGSAHYLQPGATVLLAGLSGIAGLYTVVTTPTDVTFTVAGTTYTGTCLLVGHLIRTSRAETWSQAATAASTLIGRWVPMVPTSISGEALVLGKLPPFRQLNVNDPTNQPVGRSTSLNDAVFVTNGDDEVLKFDGDYLYQAGLPPWNPVFSAIVDTNVTGGLSTGASFPYTSKNDAGHYFVLDYTTLTPGDWVYESAANKRYLVTSVTNDIATEDYHVTVRAEDDITASGSTGTLVKVLIYKYYVRLSAIDANGYAVASASMSGEDLVLQYNQSGQIVLTLILPPWLGSLNYETLQLDVFRTSANGNLFSQVAQVIRSAHLDTPYVQVYDSASDSIVAPGGAPRTPDNITGALVPPPELGTAWDRPPRAACVTSLDNRLLLANIKGYPQLDLRFRANGDRLQLPQKRWVFHRTASGAGTTTDMYDTIVFSNIYDAGSVSFTLNNATAINAGTDVITKTAHTLHTGDKFTVSGVGSTGIPATVWIIKTGANTFKVATSFADALAGTAVDITTDASTSTWTRVDAGRAISPSAAIVNNGTSFTVTTPDAHGLVAGNWVYLFHSSEATYKSMSFAGWWQIASVTTSTFTITATTGAVVGNYEVNRVLVASTPTDVPMLLGSLTYDGNLEQRDATQGSASKNDQSLILAQRFAAAINASQCTTYITDLVPWLTAFGGNDYETGQLLVRAPQADAATPELVVPSYLSDSPRYATLYANGVLVNNQDVAFETPVFQSRLVRSYQNYPEIFDAPYAPDAIYSDSIIDVNPADGQAITAMIPFFGESAGGAASQLSQYLLVFKANSVWLVNVETRVKEKLDTRGQGCTAPGSVAVTHNGVMFANASGVYRINRDLSLATVGESLTGYFRDRINRSAISTAAGHHYAFGRRYKLAVAIDGATEPNAVLVYEYDREGRGQQYGAWTVYDTHDAVLWCNLDDEAFWASYDRNVWRLRNSNVPEDYRDNVDAITARATLRAEDFDLPGTRKAIGAITTLVEMPDTDCTGLEIEAAMNLGTTFEDCGDASLTQVDPRPIDTTPPQRRGTHVQLRYTHDTIDEGCVLTGVQYTVSQLSGKRVKDTGDV